MIFYPFILRTTECGGDISILCNEKLSHYFIDLLFLVQTWARQIPRPCVNCIPIKDEYHATEQLDLQNKYKQYYTF